MAINYLGGGWLGYETTTGSITVPSGTVLLVVIAEQAAATSNIAGTIGGNALTTRATRNGLYYSTRAGRMLYYINPPTGSQTLTLTGTTVENVFWAAYDGVDTGTPFNGTTDTSQVEETDVAIARTVSAATGELVIMGVSIYASGAPLTAVAASGSTLDGSGSDSGNGYLWASEAGAASVTIGADRGEAGAWTYGAFVDRLNPASAPASTPQWRHVTTATKVARYAARW